MTNINNIRVLKAIDPDSHSLEQLIRCLRAVDGSKGALMGDNHVGYNSMPIGGVVAYKNYISPTGVGVDIGCGNKAVATNLLYPDISKDIPKIMDEIASRISFGMGRINNEKIDHPIIDKIRCDGPTREIKHLAKKAAAQLGTVGGGNHYVDLFRDEKTDRIWIGVHFGSRGFGYKIAQGFIALTQNKKFDEYVKDEMDGPPCLIHASSPLGYNYLEAMKLAGEYAYAGRDIVCDKVLEILGAQLFDEVHNHHNFAWYEKHFDEDVWVIRKGATPAFPGQRGFVGATMIEPAVIIEGVESPESAQLLYSTIHGAGRIMSRTAASGKIKKRWACQNRDCNWISNSLDEDFEKCPQCEGKTKKKKLRIGGKIDFNRVQENMKRVKIELRGAAADEAPEVYKNLDEVLIGHSGTIKVLHILNPIGVAMAGANTFDPYKD